MGSSVLSSVSFSILSSGRRSKVFELLHRRKYTTVITPCQKGWIYYTVVTPYQMHHCGDPPYQMHHCGDPLPNAPLWWPLTKCTTVVTPYQMHHCGDPLPNAPLWWPLTKCTTVVTPYQMHHCGDPLPNAPLWWPLTKCTTVVTPYQMQCWCYFVKSFRL